MSELNGILAIAYRDLLKFLRDPIRIVSTLIFPAMFVVLLGNSFEGLDTRFSFLTYVFTGILAQTLYQSTAMGIISLIEDRENDFSQEIFVSPVSRYTIVFGKIFGETLVSMTQGVPILLLGLLIGIPLTIKQLIYLFPISIIVCLAGGAFGVIVMANLNNQRAANQIFPFIMFPQYFLAGVFNPINALPWYLNILSLLSPMRYAVDLIRGIFYADLPDYSYTVLQSPSFNLIIVIITFIIFLMIGTWVFVRGERNR